MAKTGRKNKYETHIKPHLKEITEYAKNMVERDIAKALGVSSDSFYKYKKEHVELAEAIKAGQQNLVAELKSDLIKRAHGYEYEETETVILPNEEGTPTIAKKVIRKRHAPADVGAIHLLLKNYDKENWSNDWQTFEIKQQQLELSKEVEKLKAQGW